MLFEEIIKTPVEAWGYMYNPRDQREMWRRKFPSENAARAWADFYNATIVEIKPLPPKPVAESQEHTQDLDHILADLCAMVVKGKQRNPEYYGMVAAAVVDPEGHVVKAVNHFDDATDKRIHAERAAVEASEKRYGKVTPDCTIVTTLSPCSERMSDRYGSSCEQFLDELGITDVYCGYQDPTQESGYTVTGNEKIQQLCKAFADTFLGDQQLDELSFLGSPCTKDCSGHRAGYNWSAKKGNVDAASWSDSFNRGAHLRATGN